MIKSAGFSKYLKSVEIVFLLLAPFFCRAQNTIGDSLSDRSRNWVRSQAEAYAKARMEGRAVKDKDSLVVNDSTVWVCQVIYPVASRAEFIGGYSKMQRLVQDNLLKPKYSKKGKVTISLEINLLGKIDSMRIIKGLTRECDTAALEACRALVKFIPATDHLVNKAPDVLSLDVYFN